jgi:ABC-2 type transport system ATP-binding protein
VVALEGVWKRYHRSGGWILRDVDLEVTPGSVTVLVGANGAGKSTLLRIVAGLSLPDRGRVRGSAASGGRPSVAYLPDRLPVDPRSSAARYLGQMARLRGPAAAGVAARSSALLERLRVRPGPDVPMARLSRGNRQKVHLVRVFAAGAEVVVLDEPFSFLDEAASAEVARLLTEARAAGAGVILSGHDPDPVVAPDRVVELRGGELDPVPVRTTPQSPTRPTRLVLRTGDRRSPASVTSTDGELTEADLAARPGVRSVDRVGDRVVITTTEPDDVLRRALGSGWSFVEGGPGEIG